jgi:hypothetical protein
MKYVIDILKQAILEPLGSHILLRIKVLALICLGEHPKPATDDHLKTGQR